MADTPTIQADQIADAIITAPGSRIYLSDGQPVSTITIGTDTRIAPEHEASFSFDVPFAALYGIKFGATVAANANNTSVKVKLVFDEAGTPITVGDNDQWQTRVSTSGDYENCGFVGSVELSAGSHTVTAYATETSGSAMEIIGSSVTPVTGPWIEMIAVTGSGAAGSIVTSDSLVGDYTVTGSWADTGLSVDFTTVDQEVVELSMAGWVSQSSTGTTFVRFVVDATNYDEIVESNNAGYGTNTSVTRSSEPLSAGSHTVKVQAYRSAASLLKAGARLEVRQARGGQVPWQDDGTAVQDTPRAHNALVVLKAVNNSGAVDLSYEDVISDHTSNLDLENADSQKTLTNSGASGSVDFTLPTAVAGLKYTFLCLAAQTLKVITDSTADDIRIAGSITAGSSRFISTSTIGDTVTLLAISDALWLASSSHGTWTFST